MIGLAVSEKAWMQTITDLASARRWRVYHTFDSRRSAAGFPDLVMVRGPRLLFVEVKAEKGRITAAQEDWMAALRTVADATLPHVEAHIWKPSDWLLVEETLR